MKKPPDRLEWIVHPARRYPGRGAALALFTAGVPLLIYLDWGDPVLAALALGVLLLSFRGFYLPTRYVLDRRGVGVACFPFRFHRPWAAFHGWYEADGALRLTPLPRPSRLDPFRGVLLRYEEGEERIRAFLARRVPEVRT